MTPLRLTWTVRFILLRRLPIELVDQILHTAQYYTRYSDVKDGLFYKEDNFPHGTIYHLSRPITRPVKKVRISLDGHDQGWSSYQQDRGTYNNSWTWYEASIVRHGDRRLAFEGSWRIATNLHGSGEWQNHVVEWGEEHELVRRLGDGTAVAVQIFARFPQWRNYIRRCRIDIYCWI